MPSPPATPIASKSSLGQRLLTAAIGTPVALAAVFFLPSLLFAILMVAVFTVAALEYVWIVRRAAPSAPPYSLLVWMPLAAAALIWALDAPAAEDPGLRLASAGLVVVLAATLSVLFARGADAREALVAIGALAFGIPYFALPAVSTVWLQARDPWLLFLLLAIVWLGDTAAFFVGSRIGRHKMAPKVSPNKSWEGAIAGAAASLLAAAVWSWLRLGEVLPALLGVAAITALTAQLGDLVESILKRGAGVKDSSQLLPGHGGVYDRMDALILAAPVFVIALWLCGLDGAAPGSGR